MGKVIGGMTISLDGYVHDREGQLDRLYPNMDELREDDLLQAAMEATGAVVMGRHAYDMAQGDFTGYEFQTPIFVVTHDPPAVPAKGENDRLKFSFVTGGFESAVAQARAAAGDKDVQVIGGASTIQQCLQAGLLDELHIGIMPVLLGGGLRLFEQAANGIIELEKLRVAEAPGGRTEIIYRVVK